MLETLCRCQVTHEDTRGFMQVSLCIEEKTTAISYHYELILGDCCGVFIFAISCKLFTYLSLEKNSPV